MSSNFRNQLEAWLRTLDIKADRVIDIGGSSFPIKGRVNSFDVQEYKILDNNNEKEHHEKWHKPDIFCDINEMPFSFHSEDYDFNIKINNKDLIDELKRKIYLREKNRTSVFEKDGKLFELINGKKTYLKEPTMRQCELLLGGYFDVCFVLEVFEYIFDPFSALKNINWFIKKNGLLYISFPFIYPAHNPLEDDCLRITPIGAEKLLRKTGFKIIDHKYRTGNNLILDFYSRDRMRPSKEFSQHNVIGSLITAQKNG